MPLTVPTLDSLELLGQIDRLRAGAGQVDDESFLKI